jgi:hypothetical protein
VMAATAMQLQQLLQQQYRVIVLHTKLELCHAGSAQSCSSSCSGNVIKCM